MPRLGSYLRNVGLIYSGVNSITTITKGHELALREALSVIGLFFKFTIVKMQRTIINDLIIKLISDVLIRTMFHEFLIQ